MASLPPSAFSLWSVRVAKQVAQDFCLFFPLFGSGFFFIPSPLGECTTVRGLKLAPTGQGGSFQMVEQDPCP